MVMMGMIDDDNGDNNDLNLLMIKIKIILSH